MTNAGSQWLRDRLRDFRDRADCDRRREYENAIVARAVIYEDQAESMETTDPQCEALVARVFYPARPHVRLSTGRPVSQYAGNEGCAG
jgi:hypothetical protein